MRRGDGGVGGSSVGGDDWGGAGFYGTGLWVCMKGGDGGEGDDGYEIVLRLGLIMN